MGEVLCNKLPGHSRCKKDIAKERCPGSLDCRCYARQNLQSHKDAGVKGAVSLLQFRRVTNGPVARGFVP